MPPLLLSVNLTHYLDCCHNDPELCTDTIIPWQITLTCMLESWLRTSHQAQELRQSRPYLGKEGGQAGEGMSRHPGQGRSRPGQACGRS